MTQKKQKKNKKNVIMDCILVQREENFSIKLYEIVSVYRELGSPARVVEVSVWLSPPESASFEKALKRFMFQTINQYQVYLSLKMSFSRGVFAFYNQKSLQRPLALLNLHFHIFLILRLLHQPRINALSGNSCLLLRVVVVSWLKFHPNSSARSQSYPENWL